MTTGTGTADLDVVGTGLSSVDEAGQPPSRTGRSRRRGLILLQVAVIVAVIAVIAVVNETGSQGREKQTDPAIAASPDAAATHPAARNTASLPAFEQRQLTVNQSKLSGDLASFAAPWLAWVSGCESNLEPAGLTLREGEVSRVVCWYGSVAVYFVQYQNLAERDRVRARVVGDNFNAKTLAPGARDPAENRPSVSGRTAGMYIEYAYQLTSGEHNGETVCGVWWDDGDRPMAGYLLAFWRGDLGESWAPLRDVWQRNS